MSRGLVLLPGLLNDHRLWLRQAAALGGEVEVLVADLTLDESLGAMAERVLGAAPERFALAGLSMGGYVALEIMRRAPGRVERLALLDTTARPDLPEQTQRRRDAVELARSGGFDKIMPTMLPLLLHPDHLADAAITALAKDMARAVGAQAFARQQAAIMARPDSRDSLAAIACPTLVLCGAEDTLTPPDRHDEMAALIKGARRATIAHCGHLSPLEQPDAVSAELRAWLSV
ncbi:alpha/beta fold hydrolase [Paramagnetospirillum magneticum]|uniref:Predicted hydrolase or acyltransferase n=1 Tax=Paramagnetospirillum magneticum (strain ATCC 700264 / AMB-1) TaxID=342108 RepID=Q2W3S0_PARM1|nr:alpha/beta fold hydrolase [Paramagnetospirillum magneticum]BAE51505.1 Predicted hydrolase or acyltransferase [Paramagnetospirillum magneticum AMB-1]